ncbi:MAG TPA: replication-associated recombination protein A [Phycisphaerae bacterium]|nr:replication-associated recombination protein A [Phycisphaerae bacterium]
MDLFAGQQQEARRRAAPLAVRLRPRTLDEFVGQQHFLGPGKLLRRLLTADRLSSAVFFGPPGCGKTSLAMLIAEHTRAAFHTLHAAEAGVKDVRAVLDQARARLERGGGKTVLFLDEVHRFNRAQQDVLLRDVEEGALTLIGATTENPFFALTAPLISRSQLFEFQPLTGDDLLALLHRALSDPRGLLPLGVECGDDALRLIVERSGGDARRALTALEVAALSITAEHAGAAGPPRVTAAVAAESLQRKAIPFDRAGDAHYDLASALIKSLRASQADAALYWLARLLEGGEDVRFIARRLAIFASEDVGEADPQALVVAAAAVSVTEFVGPPECQYALAQAVVHLALAPKSRAVTEAIAAARQDVREQPLRPVPPQLRDASYAGAARLGRGRSAERESAADGYRKEQRRYYNAGRASDGGEATDAPPDLPSGAPAAPGEGRP